MKNCSVIKNLNSKSKMDFDDIFGGDGDDAA